MPTINDVASESGVSIGTVSTVLNNAPRPVRAETRQRVLAAAKRLGYHPNAMASGLVRGRMDTIGVLSGVFQANEVVSDPYAAGVLTGILGSASEAGFHVTIFTKFWQDRDHSASAYRDRRTDGIVLIAPGTNSDMVSVLTSFGIALVTIAAAPAHGIPSVDVDSRHGAMLAAQHLLDLGHRRIAHIAGNDDQLSARERRESFVEALAEAGCGPRHEYVVKSKYSGDTTEDAMQYLLSLAEPPTAIFAANDAIARRAVSFATGRGLDVPRDLSIIGFDDNPVAYMNNPPLTTIQHPLREVGALAAKLLIDRINGRNRPAERHLIEPTLVVRATTSSARC